MPVKSALSNDEFGFSDRETDVPVVVVEIEDVEEGDVDNEEWKKSSSDGDCI